MSWVQLALGRAQYVKQHLFHNILTYLSLSFEFINETVGKQLLEVGQSMTSCTNKPCPVVVDPIPGYPNLGNRRLVLVDTPGFDDTYEEDVEILKRIATWLEKS